MATDTSHRPNQPKRLIVCCDGSWMDSLGSKGGEPQSNVSRLARVVRRTCHDGTHQVISYDAGVGTGTLKLDQYTGGGFGMGLAENVREAFNFVSTNHVDGDEIILVGFSRGAFTARSVADMIATIGLLNPSGLDWFYRIFEDYQNIASPTRGTSEFLCPAGTIAPYGGQKGPVKADWADARRVAYKNWLLSVGYTRDHTAPVTEPVPKPSEPIRIKALAVWDTVGTLGIPPVSWLGLVGSADQWKFSNTQISSLVENAFQALALDEPRDAFKPALWERLSGNTSTNLRQVWFPGNHGGVGGGWHDQQMANISLAWMCDQLSASVGIEFNYDRMRSTFLDGVRYSTVHPDPFVPNWANTIKLDSLASWLTKAPLPWSSHTPPFCGPNPGPAKRDGADCDPSCKQTKHNVAPLADVASGSDSLCADARPWALGQIRYPPVYQTIIGASLRHPGLYMRTDPDTNKPTDQPLLRTAETVHSSVRVRLACGGLNMDDREAWRCEPLVGGAKEGFGAQGLWKLAKGSALDSSERARLAKYRPRELEHPAIYPCDDAAIYHPLPNDGGYKWVFGDDSNLVNAGGPKQTPQTKVLPEEPLVGYWERFLLKLTVGQADVWRFAEENPPIKV